MIVMFHYIEHAANAQNLPFKCGAIGVEFFFLVSGYLMAKKAMKIKNVERNLGEETIEYIWKKFKVFFPYILIAFIFSFIVKNWAVSAYNTQEAVNTVWNLLLLQMTGITTSSVVGQTWYISAMFISMLILYPLIRKYKKNFIYIIAPLIVILIGGWLSHKYVNLRGPLTWTGIVYKGLARAFFELSLGTILYEVCEKIKNINFNKLGKVVLTIIEVLGFTSMLIISNIKNLRYDYIAIGLVSIAIVLAFSEKTLLLKFCNNKLFYYLEKLSLPVYLNHIWIILIIKKMFTNTNDTTKLLLSVVITIIVSIIIMFLLEKLKGKPTSLAKKIFISKEVEE